MMVADLAEFVDPEFDWLVLPSNAAPGDEPNFFLLMMPEAPDSSVAFYQYPGEPDIETMDGPKVERPRLQVMVRDVDNDIAERRSVLIRNILRTIKGVTINGVYYHKVTPVASPGPIGPDVANRFRWTTNYSVWKDVDSGD